MLAKICIHFTFKWYKYIIVWHLNSYMRRIFKNNNILTHKYNIIYMTLNIIYSIIWRIWEETEIEWLHIFISSGPPPKITEAQECRYYSYYFIFFYQNVICFSVRILLHGYYLSILFGSLQHWNFKNNVLFS